MGIHEDTYALAELISLLPVSDQAAAIAALLQALKECHRRSSEAERVFGGLMVALCGFEMVTQTNRLDPVYDAGRLLDRLLSATRDTAAGPGMAAAFAAYVERTGPR